MHQQQHTVSCITHNCILYSITVLLLLLLLIAFQYNRIVKWTEDVWTEGFWSTDGPSEILIEIVINVIWIESKNVQNSESRDVGINRNKKLEWNVLH